MRYFGFIAGCRAIRFEGTKVLTSLHKVEVVPAVELEPFLFANPDRTRPAGTSSDSREEWNRYWYDSVEDSGVVGLTPLWLGSWHVPVKAITNTAVLARYLETMIGCFDGLAVLSDPEARPVLSGGLALCSYGKVLVEPSCCSDLANLSEWRDAVAYQQTDWKMVWIGHPWVSVRFVADRLEFSEPHELTTPNARWTIAPDEFGRAVDAAEVELKTFSRQLWAILTDMGVPDANTIAMKLAGLKC